MSQEKAKNKEKDPGETRKKIWLGVLLLVMVVVFYFQFFSDSDSGAGQTVAVNNPQRKASPTPTPRALRPGEKAEPIITEPLKLAWFDRNISGEGTGRNIFIYPPPTPPPTPKPLPPTPPPTPLPIQLSSINPPGVLGRTGAFPMTVFGDKFPADAQVFIDGRPYPTKVINQTRLELQVPAEAIYRSGNLGVQVRSTNDANLFSNQLSLNVAEPQPPPYRYVGLITSKKGLMAVLKSQADENEVLTVVKGEKFDKHWRVLNITTQKIEIEDTNNKIVFPVNFTSENN